MSDYFKVITLSFAVGGAFLATICLTILWIVGKTTGFEAAGSFAISLLLLQWMTICLKRLTTD